MSIGTGVVVLLLSSGAVAMGWWSDRGGPLGAPWATPIRVAILSQFILLAAGSIAIAIAQPEGSGPVVAGLAIASFGGSALLLSRWHRTTWAVRVGQVPSVPRAALLAGIGLVSLLSLAGEFGLPLLTNDPQSSRIGYAGTRLDLFRWTVPAAALLALSMALDRGQRRATAIALGVIAGTAGLEILAASRALPLELGLAAILIWVWSGRRVSVLGWIAVAAIGGAIFLGVLFARAEPSKGPLGPLDALGFAAERTVGRVILIQPRTLDLIVTTYPSERPFLQGATYTRWADRLAGRDSGPSLGSILFQRMFPDEPPGGFLAPGLLGEAYANFGLLFALGIMAALGGTAAALSPTIVALSRDPAGRVLAALLVVALVRTNATSLLGFLLTAGAAVAWWVVVAAPLKAWTQGALTRIRTTRGSGS